MNVKKYLQDKTDGTLKSAAETRKPSNVEKYLAKKKGAAAQGKKTSAKSNTGGYGSWKNEPETPEQ